MCQFMNCPQFVCTLLKINESFFGLAKVFLKVWSANCGCSRQDLMISVVGFNSRSTFARACKQDTGMSPGEFRYHS